jgi:hypothetical protein
MNGNKEDGMKGEGWEERQRMGRMTLDGRKNGAVIHVFETIGSHLSRHLYIGQASRAVA